MVNITKPPKDNFFNNYQTIGKEIQEHQNLFPEVGPMDFSIYKQRTSTVNYDIIQASKDAQLCLKQLHLESTQNFKDDNLQEQAFQFQSLLRVGDTHKKRHGKGIHFAAISMSESSQDDLQKEFTDYHTTLSDQEDKERLLTRRNLFTTLSGARDSLAIIRPQLGIPEPVKFKVLIPEPEPIFVVDILVQRLANMYLPFQPPNSNLKFMHEQCDVIITVRKSLQVQDIERILCHSKILNKSSNAFKELFSLYVWDMQLQEKHDIHCATTSDEGVWKITNPIIPIYLPCHIHLEETTRPKPFIEKKFNNHVIDPCCSRHETFEDWVDPKDEDRTCDEVERASDYESKENPLYEGYLKLVDEELNVDAEQFVRRQNTVEESGASEVIEELIPTPLDVTFEEEPPTEGEDVKFNPLENLPKDMELVERRKIEADTLLTICKPFLENLAVSETKDTLDDEMLENLQKFVTVADEYFVLTHPEVVKKESVKFEYYFEDGPSERIVHKGRIIQSRFLDESIRNSIMLKSNILEDVKNKSPIVVDKETQEGLNNGVLSRNSKTGSIIPLSPIKRPNELFAKLKLERKESLLRRKKNIIKKILYPIEDILIEPQAHLLDIEQQLDLCLPPPMAWQIEQKTKEQLKKEKENAKTKSVEGENDKQVEEIEAIVEDIQREVKARDESKIEGRVEEVEEEEEHEEEVCNREHKHDSVENINSKALKIYKIIKGEWTSTTFHAMLEYFYTERCHASCEEVAPLWIAATQIILQSLTNIIILHPIDEYLRLALKTEENRRHLLKLANVSYKSDLNPNMGKLKRFCELFEYGGSKECLPYTFTLFTAFIVDREIESIEEGFHEMQDLKVCILKDYNEKEQLFAKNANGVEFFTFEKRLEDQTHHRQHYEKNWLGRKVDETFLNNNRQKKWSITIFSPFIADECFKFYEYLVGQTFLIKELETISLHMPIPFLKQPVLHKAIKKAFPQQELLIESNRGMSYYIGGETHGNSITITGHPLLILEAVKCVPLDLVGRVALRFRAPCKKTFLKIFSISTTIGIDIEKDQIFLLKNFKKIKLALEYFVGLSDEASIPWNIPREFTELVVPSKPF